MLDAKFTKLFLDDQKVASKLAAGERRVLSKIGAAVRGTAQKSLKYTTGKSPAGSPPHAHRHQGFTRRFGKSKTGRKRPTSPLRELISFAYDASNNSVVVGPVLFRGSAVGAGKAPRTLEQGGSSPVVVDGKIRRGTYPARPYMAPALRAQLPTAQRELKDMIR